MISRRQLLKFAAALPVVKLAGAGAPIKQARAAEATARPASNVIPWRNWSGLQVAHPRQRVAPASIEDLQQLVAEASGGVVRPVGAGHSFTPLMNTDDVLLSLDRIQGLVDYDNENHTAVMEAGTRLYNAGELLDEVGQAFPNMPDIAEQSLAGAFGTATHGTGAGLGCMPVYVNGLELITADGERVYCDADTRPDLFQAARVNLGALGVLSRVHLQNRPSYRLERTLEWQPIEEILAEADALADRHRNFEFFYIPFSGWGFMDRQDITDAEIRLSEDHTDQNEGVYTLQSLRDWLGWSSRLRGFAMDMYMRRLPAEHTVLPSWQTYTHTRAVRFNEMEYHLPREEGLKAFREIREVLEKNFPEVFFPFEVRWVQADDIWLSPFYRRDCISIAVHRYYDEDHTAFFKAVEPIFRRYGGRPHWGKLHSLGPQELAALYPHWDDFLEVRQAMDPEGRFLNTYLRELFGV